MKTLKTALWASLLLLTLSCGKDDESPEPQNTAPVIEAQSFDISEAATTADTIGKVQATDPDSGDELTFSITANDNDLFEISSSGELRLAAGKSLDFETVSTHTITIQVTDGEDQTSATITINIVDVDENTAPIIADQSFDIVENNTIDALVGQLMATDAEDNPLTYSLSDENTVFSVASNGEIKALAVLDYETTATYTLNVSVSDGSLSSMATVTINVTDSDVDEAFITTWKTTNANEVVIIPTNTRAYTYNYTVDWGDGSANTTETGAASHTYTTAGIYTVKITGDFPAIRFSSGSSEGGGAQASNGQIQSIEQWGEIQWATMQDAFQYTETLAINATDAPDLSNVTVTSQMFYNSNVTATDLSHWDVSNVESMNSMFRFAKKFNADLNGWNTAKVTGTGMAFMFEGATAFDGSMADWKTRGITSMGSMFHSASAFTGKGLETWDVSSVTNFSRTFYRASVFDGDIGGWKVTSATHMTDMFWLALEFNQDISGWDVSNVINMQGMFFFTNKFSIDLSGWDTSKVISCSNFAPPTFNTDYRPTKGCFAP